MSTSIDQRIVEMQFDNKHFETNVATTMSTLDKLKQKLNLGSASDGLSSLTKAANKVDFSSISHAVDAITPKFSFLYTFADQTFRNIVNAAERYATRLASAFTLDPVKTGLSEYETKINAIQVIKANTRGKNTMDDITGALDELNTYADRTIYNFTQMTDNVGKFVAQGLEVHEAAKAVQGLANLAGASGASAQDMARATYQMSQALGGTIRKIDWNSLRNANMATVELKNTLMDLARVNGVSIDAMIKKHGTFEETLEEGWLTGELFTKAMNIYSDVYSEAELKAMGFKDEQIANFKDLAKTAAEATTEVKTFTQLMEVLKETAQSGWTQSWEIIVGDFDTAKAMWTDLQNYFSDIINDWSQSRNDILQGWADLGGRTSMIYGLQNAWNALLSVLKPIGKAFRNVFPKTTSEQLYNLTKRFQEFTSKLSLNHQESQKLKSVFEGLFSAIDMGIDFVKDLASGFVKILSSFSGFGASVLDTTASIGEWLTGLRDASKEADIFGQSIDKVVGFISNAIVDIKTFAGYLKDTFVTTGLEAVLGVFTGIDEVLDSIFAGLSEVISGIGTAFGNAFRSGDVKAVMDIVNAGILTSILTGIKGFTGDLSKSLDTVTESFTSLFDVFKDIGEIPKSINTVLGAVKDTLVAYQNEIKARTILTIATAIGILAASVAIIAMIDTNKLEDSLGAISVLFVNLMSSLALFGKLPTAVKGIAKSVVIMVGLSVAVSILASALKKVADVDSDKLFSSVLGVAGLSAIVVAMAKSLSKGAPGVIKGAAQMVIFAVAIGVLAESCKQLSSLSWGELIKGLAGVGVLMAEVALFMNKATFSNKAIGTATGMVILAGAIKILASACEVFGEMDLKVVVQGLIAVGVVLAELAAFTKMTADANKTISTAISLTILGAAMLIFAKAVEAFGSIPWQQLALGLGGMAGALLIVTTALGKMPMKWQQNLVTTGTGLVIVAAAMVVLAEALARMGGLGVTGVITSISAMAGAMAILAPSLKAMNSTLAGSAALIVAAGALVVLGDVLIKLGGMSPSELLTSFAAFGTSMVLLATGLRAMTGTTSGSAALLVAAAALVLIAGSIKTLGSVGLSGVIVSLVALAGVFTVFGVAGLLLGPLVPVLQGLGVAIMLFGAGCLAAGAGIAVFAAGLSMLAEGGTEAVDMLIKAIDGFFALIPSIVSSLGEAIISFVKVIADGAPALGEALINLVKMAVDVIKTCAVDIAEGVLELVLRALELFTKYTPQILDFLAEFLVNLINSLATHIPELVSAAMNLIGAFFQGVIDALSGIDTDVIIKAILGVGLLGGLLVALGSISSFIPSAMVGILGMGVALAELTAVIALIGALAQMPGLKWLVEEGGNLLEALGVAIGKLVGGLVGGIVEGATSVLPAVGKDLAGFMENATPFIDGAKQIDGSVADAAKSLASVVLTLTAAKLLDGIAKFITGGSSLSDFGKELAKFGPSFKKYSDAVKGVNPAVVTASAHAAQALSEMASGLPNKGGLVSWFTGDNDLASFSEDLVPFGKSMKKYSDAVTGVNTAVVTASANAAKALSELANGLPNSGGIVSWFTGDNDLASFGESLISFGKNFAKYAGYMTDVDSGVLSSTTAAADSIVKLQKSLPEKGGWFSDDMSLGDFALDVATFGKRMSTYYESIKSINVSQMEGVITQTNNLVSMLKGLSGINTDNASTFVEAMKVLGQNGVTGFVNAFKGAKDSATSAVSTFVSAALLGVKNKNSDFESAGQNLMAKVVAGIRTKDTTVSSAVSNVITTALTKVENAAGEFNSVGRTLITNLTAGIRARGPEVSDAVSNIISGAATRIKNKNPEFESAGRSMMVNLIGGFRSKDDEVSTMLVSILTGALNKIKDKASNFEDVGKGFMNNVIAGIKANGGDVGTAASDAAKAAADRTKKQDCYDKYKEAGKYLVQGFAKGIELNTWIAEEATKKMAQKAIDKARQTLDINSPSKVFMAIGSGVVEGFVKGIRDDSNASEAAAANMATQTIDAFKSSIARISDAINSDIDMQPTIRPVLDLSNVKAGSAKLNTMFSRSQALSVSASMQRGSSYSTSDGASVATTGSTFQFTQINNSPKALSRTEIYRQTSNQFSAFERMVKA